MYRTRTSPIDIIVVRYTYRVSLITVIMDNFDPNKNLRQGKLPSSQSDYYGIVDYTNFLKRTERIVAALHVVTDMTSQNSPIGHKIQSLGVELVVCTVSLSPSLTEEETLRDYSKRLLEIASLLEVGFVAGRVSEMNYTIITNEIDKILNNINRIHRRSSELSTGNQSITRISSIISKSLMVGGKATSTKSVKDKIIAAIHKGHSISHTKSRGIRQSKSIKYSNTGNKEYNADEKMVSKESRKDALVSLLKDGSHLSIKDFMVVVPNVSEKTIQRDLNLLVSSGVLKKEGERRWCKYYITHSDVNNK